MMRLKHQSKYVFCDKLCWLILLLLSGLHQAVAAQYSGSGIDKEKEQAKKNALVELQQSIYVYVDSSIELHQSNSGQNSFESQSKFVSSLPILGASYDCQLTSGLYHCAASIDTEHSAPVYQKIINEKHERINKQWLAIGKISSENVRRSELHNLSGLLEEANRLSLVLNVLAPETVTLAKQVNIDEVKLALAVSVDDESRDYAVTIRSNVSNDRTFINGKSYGSTPVEVMLAKGSYLVTIEKEGYESFQRTINVSNKQDNIIRAKLIEEESVLKDLTEAAPELIDGLESSVSKGVDTASSWLFTLFKWIMYVVGALIALLVYLIVSGRMKKIVTWMNE